MTTDRPTHIVTYAHRPKRAPRKPKAAAVAITVPRIVVTEQPKGRPRQRPEPDPDGEASVRAFFKRMMPDHPLLQDD